MWYDQTNGLPDDVVCTAILELAPRYDRDNVPMKDRAFILWKQTKGEPPDYQMGWLFATPQALVEESLKPLFVLINGTKQPYNTKSAGYIGNPAGYCPKGYERTPLPNRLNVFIIEPLIQKKENAKTGDFVIHSLYAK